MDKNEVAPAGDAFARIRLDASEQPSFVGNLAVEVTAAGAKGEVLFRFNVLAEVVPEDELAFCDATAP